MEIEESAAVSLCLNSAILAKEARRLAISITSAAGSSHIGSALSTIDILAVLYSGAANISPTNWSEHNRDCIIFSKGHAASGLYAILTLTGFISMGDLKTFGANGSVFGGHVTHNKKIGVDLSTGSLGHGMPYGVGIALAQQRNKEGGRTFVVISDGECDEGTTWESALLAQQFKLDNLVVIIDRNRIQSLGPTEDVMALEPLTDKWLAFNWVVRNVDGHSYDELMRALTPATGPLCIIAETIKGKGVSFMEDSVLWHYRSPNDDELRKSLIELTE
jgi:transketolase